MFSSKDRCGKVLLKPSSLSSKYLQAIGNTAELFRIFVEQSPGSGIAGKKTLSVGPDVIDVVADIVEAQALLYEQGKLIESQIALQQQLARLEAKDPANAAQWRQILQDLYGDPAAQHAAFLQWLAAHGLSEKDVMAQVLNNAARDGPTLRGHPKPANEGQLKTGQRE